MNFYMDFNFAENFTFNEVSKSKDHPDLIEGNRNYFGNNPELIKNMTLCICEFMQPIRYLFGGIGILSGIRDTKLSKAIYLKQNPSLSSNEAIIKHLSSQHPRGQALDFRTLEMDIEKAWIRLQKLPLKWHQLIYYEEMGFIHFGYPVGRDDMQTEKIEKQKK